MFSYQWQNSADNTVWTNISGAVSSGYMSPALTQNTYFRRGVISGALDTVYSEPVLVSISPLITLAQLHDSMTIFNNTATDFYIDITGGTSPFTINYTRNGVAQPEVVSYLSGTLISTDTLVTGSYIYELTSVTDTIGCSAQSLGTVIEINVVDNGDLTPGTTGIPQTICYNTVPAPLTEITAPTGGTGEYRFQWQSSPDSIMWFDLTNDTLQDYTPPALTATTWFRRMVLSDGFLPVAGNNIEITVSPQFTLAQLHNDTVIANNTSTVFNVEITGGTSPFAMDYTQNGIAQSPVINYISGTDISTGILTAGSYVYVLTSVTDAYGCTADSLGDSITVSVINYIAVDSLFRTEIPDTSVNDGRYELGTEFRVLSNGFLTKALLYTGIDEGGEHTVRLWELNGTVYSLLSGPFTWNLSSGTEGWRDFTFTSPVVVHENTTYIISISNSTDNYYAKTENFVYVPHGLDLSYLRGVYSTTLGTAPVSTAYESNYYRDVVFAVAGADTLTPGSVGYDQTICYNTSPEALLQVTAPIGGTGVYAYQWQSSPDNSVWTNITGGVSSDYMPPALTQNTWFRRGVISGALDTVYSDPVVITISPLITLAQLHDSVTIFNNTVTTFYAEISGGTSPYTLNYTRNGVAQTAISLYVSGAGISTDTLTTGSYIYALTSVTDAAGCPAQNLGTVIEITVIDNGDLTPGTITASQTICYNTVPVTLTQETAPSGGTGEYRYQWQSSPDSVNWTDLTADTLEDYSPPALTATSWFRRVVTSGSYLSVISNKVRISVSPQIPLAQLHDNIIIANNSSTVFNVDIAGGTSPFIIDYAQNGVAQSTISGYISGTDISTGILTTGNYVYALTSVTDVYGCEADSLGDSITVTAADYTPLDSLFRFEIPYTSSGDDPYELGSEFQVLSDGYLLKARLYSHINEGGEHIIRLWRFNGTSYDQLAGPYTWSFSSGISGWRDYNFPSPIAVEENGIYIISITNGPDLNYVRTDHFQTTAEGTYVSFIRGLYSPVIGEVPDIEYLETCYFRDVVFGMQEGNGSLTAGSVGSSQTLCYNSVPAPLTEISAPSGGTGVYEFQWQNSLNNSVWTDIPGAVQQDYSPPALTSTTWFRRVVTSGTYLPVNSSSIQISISSQITLAQLHDSSSIANNTSTYFNVTVTGGTSPYIFDYTRNGVIQSTVTDYFSGTSIATGILTTGDYTYELTSLTDAYGCMADSLGTSININVSDSNGIILNSNTALVIINSNSAFYNDYELYIKAYLDNFGIPYDTVDVNITALPDLNNYAIIIFGHNRVYESGYPIVELEQAISEGIGLCAFDPHLFDYSSNFNTLISQTSVTSDQIEIPNTTHYITRTHEPDTYNPSNDVVQSRNPFTTDHNSNLSGGINLVTMSSGGNTVPLLQVASHGNGRIVRWNSYEWVYEWILGPVYGMDDLFWRSIVWAARKPFVMQGLPPMLTMRVDDVDGAGTGVADNFSWIDVCNEFGIIPWCGTFNATMPPAYIPKLKSLIDNNLATAFPHALDGDLFIYFNHNSLPIFDPVKNTEDARDFFIQNGLTLSNYLVPHYYELSTEALPAIYAMGGEFLGIHMLPDDLYNSGGPWINCGPYRIGRNGSANQIRPVYYGGPVVLNGIEFYDCVIEIRDDGGYEWFPDNNISPTVARGVRHLRRSFNSMVMASLFTHEQYFDGINESDWRTIFQQLTAAITDYNPEYTSTDYTVKYIRAKTKIRITSVVETNANVEISYSGSNDMDTKCMLYTEEGGQITSRFVGLPQVNGSHIISVTK